VGGKEGKMGAGGSRVRIVALTRRPWPAAAEVHAPLPRSTSKAYRGTSLIGKRTHLEFYRRPMPEFLGVS